MQPARLYALGPFSETQRLAEVQKAIAELEASGQPVSAQAVLRMVGGRRNTVQALFKQARALSQQSKNGDVHPSAPLHPTPLVPMQPPRTRLPRLSPQQVQDRLVKMAPLTYKMIQWLEACVQDTFYPYAIINQAIGINVQHYLPNFKTARDFLLDRDHKCIVLLKGKGVIWVTESGKISVGASYRKMAHNKLRKAMKYLGSVDIEALPVHYHMLWVAGLSTSTTGAIATDDKMVEKIVAQKAPQPILIDLYEFEDLFQGLLPPRSKSLSEGSQGEG